MLPRGSAVVAPHVDAPTSGRSSSGGTKRPTKKAQTKHWASISAAAQLCRATMWHSVVEMTLIMGLMAFSTGMRCPAAPVRAATLATRESDANTPIPTSLVNLHQFTWDRAGPRTEVKKVAGKVPDTPIGYRQAPAPAKQLQVLRYANV